MIEIVEKIEEIVKEIIPSGIMGFYRTYIPNKIESYLIEIQNCNYSFSSFEKISEIPNIKIYFLSADVNCDLHVDKRDFYIKSEKIVKKLFQNPTLDETVTQFSIDVKYSSIRRDKDYKVCEILIKVEEII